MEAINLNLIPNGTNPVVHCSQYDEGREFRFNLFDGASVFVLDGTEDISCDIKKPDGNIVTAAVPNTEDDYIIVTTTLQMTACSGNSLGTINISKGGINLYTLNFVLYCERSPLENGIESESSIHNLESMVDEMVAEEVATQYDSANVIFDTEPTDNHGIGYTVTSEGIKTAIDNAFDYDNTASGSLVHITDGADNIPVKSLVSQIVAVESGSGEKSPDNPYTISGFDSGVITRCGKNLIDDSKYYQLNANIVVVGQTETNANRRVYLPKGTYTIAVTSGVSATIYYDFGNGSTSLGNTTAPRTFTLSENSYCSFWIYKSGGFTPSDYTTIQLEVGDTATTYEPYTSNTYTFAFGQTIYGGHFDNKGNLVVTHDIAILDGTENTWAQSTSYDFRVTLANMKSGNFLSGIAEWLKTATDTSEPLSIRFGANNNLVYFYGIINNILGVTDLASWKTYLSNNPLKIVYELATPITLSITSQDIPTLLGENNIFSNCGDVEVTYYTSKSNDILEFVDSEIGKKNGTNIPIEANSQDSIKDYVDNGLSGKADTSDLNDKQDKNVLNIVKHYDSGTSSDAITDIITEYGKVNMVFAFDVPLGYFTGCLTFANDNMGSGFIVLSTTGRFWVVSYVSGTITLTELT